MLYKLVWGLNITEKKTNSQTDSLPGRQDRTGSIPGNTWSEGGLKAEANGRPGPRQAVALLDLPLCQLQSFCKSD